MAPANTVNTRSIVNGSIRLADLHPSAVRMLKGQKGDTGAPGPQGPQGLQGLTGPAGIPGTAGTKVDTYQLMSDLQKLCRAVGEIQKTYPLGTFWLSDFKYSSCLYLY